MKITIVGAAGSVGSAAAFYLAAQGLAHEIVMIGGRRQNVLMQHAMDLGTAVAARDVKIIAGDYPDMAGSDIVINAAGVQQGLITDRMQMLPKNIALVVQIARNIKRYCPAAFVITATNPVDPLNYATFLSGGFDRRQLVGYSINDSFRFRQLLGQSFHANTSRIDGAVIGEHGSTQVLLFSTARIDGQPLSVSADLKRAIKSEVAMVLKRYEELQAGRTAGWTCAVGIEMIVRAIVENSAAVIPCSVVLNGEYGLRDMSMSVPVALGKEGIQQILEYDLSAEERQELTLSAAALKTAARFVEQHLSECGQA